MIYWVGLIIAEFVNATALAFIDGPLAVGVSGTILAMAYGFAHSLGKGF